MSYDIIQSAFLIKLASNGASSISGTQTELTQYLSAFLNGGKTPINTDYEGFFPFLNPKLAGGDWKVVWGPAVVLPPNTTSGEAANAAFVAYSANEKTYVVSIAATNPASIYDWVSEDGDVSARRMAQWPISLPFTVKPHPWPYITKPAVSAATARGVSAVLTQLQDPDTDFHLQDFLEKLVTDGGTQDHTLIFGGHSLAGALAPTVADFIYPEPQNSGWKNVFVLPSAGATPGNGKFASQWNNTYPATPANLPGKPSYGVWNVDMGNHKDLVPHAWNKLGEIAPKKNSNGNYDFIFGTLSPELGKDLHKAVLLAEGLALGGNYTNLNQEWFQPNWGYWEWTQNEDGTYQYPPAWKTAPVYTDDAPLSKALELGPVLIATHVDQYFNFYNVVPPPRFPTKKPSTSNPSADPHQEALLAAAKVSE